MSRRMLLEPWLENEKQQAFWIKPGFINFFVSSRYGPAELKECTVVMARAVFNIKCFEVYDSPRLLLRLEIIHQ